MWVQIDEFPEYFVDETGRVLSTQRRQCRELKQQNKKGYMTVSLYSGKANWRLVHVLVAKAFLGVKPKGYDVNHKDGNKLNNELSNLEYVTRSANVQHAYDNGLHPITREVSRMNGAANTGESNGRSKLTDIQAAQVLAFRGKGRTQTDVAQMFGVSQRTVSKIWAGQRKNSQNS